MQNSSVHFREYPCILNINLGSHIFESLCFDKFYNVLKNMTAIGPGSLILYVVLYSFSPPYISLPEYSHLYWYCYKWQVIFLCSSQSELLILIIDSKESILILILLVNI